MVEIISAASKAIDIGGKLWSIWKIFRPTTLKIIGIDQEWVGGVLVHKYRFMVNKPYFSGSACKAPISLNIPQELGIAEFRLSMPEVQTRPITVPASKISISANDLIGNHLESFRNGQEISVSLRIPFPSKDVVEVEESQQASHKLYKIRNPNNFPLKSCDYEWPIFLNEVIHEIQIVKRGEVVSYHRLMKMRATFSIDFEAGELAKYFPIGISPTHDDWLKVNRTEKNCVLRLTIDLDPCEEIEIRLFCRYA